MEYDDIRYQAMKCVLKYIKQEVVKEEQVGLFKNYVIKLFTLFTVMV